MRTTVLTLEPFDEPEEAPVRPRRARPRAVETAPPPPTEAEIDARLSRARGEGRAEGYAEGAAEAEARGLAELRLIAAELREQIEDARHARAERREAEAAALLTLGRALLQAVAPAFARAGLAAEVAEAAAEVLRDRRLRAAEETPVMRIRVSPAQHAAVAAALARAGLAAPVEADPALGDLHARLDWADGEDVVDLDAALAAARETLDRHLSPTAEVKAHG